MHVAGCIIFLMLPVLFSPARVSFKDMFTVVPAQKELLTYLLLIIFFYLNFFILLPNYYFTKKYFIFFGAVVIFFTLINLIPVLFIHDGMPVPPPPSHGPQHEPPQAPSGFSAPEIFHNLSLFLVVFFFALIISVTNRWRQTEKEKLNTELLYLKAQINPHFLFNTLNTIYSLALERSNNTANAVIQLSQMMRYVLDDAQKNFVELEKEFAYLQSYIELQKVRFGDSLKLNFSLTGNANGKKIAPLILIPFIENSFKHGINAEENALIEISLNVHDDVLNLYVSNNKVMSMQPTGKPGGLGIKNTKARLQLLYAGKHILKITDKEKTFIVSLTLQLA